MHRSILITSRSRGLKASSSSSYCCCAASLALVVHLVRIRVRHRPQTTTRQRPSACKKQSNDLTFKQSIELSKAVATDTSVDVDKSQLAAIQSEMAMYESSGKGGRNLQLV